MYFKSFFFLAGLHCRSHHSKLHEKYDICFTSDFLPDTTWTQSCSLKNTRQQSYQVLQVSMLFKWENYNKGLRRVGNCDLYQTMTFSEQFNKFTILAAQFQTVSFSPAPLQQFELDELGFLLHSSNGWVHHKVG